MMSWTLFVQLLVLIPWTTISVGAAVSQVVKTAIHGRRDKNL